MSFRYFNPGYAGLLVSNNSYYSAKTIESAVYNPVNGVAVDLSASSSEAVYKIPISESLGTDIYGVFNLFYIASYLDSFLLGGLTNNATTYSASCLIGLRGYNSKIYVLSYNYNRVGEGVTLTKNAVNKVWFHIHNEGTASNSISESYVEVKTDNGENKQNISYDYAFTSSCKFLFVKAMNSGIYLSNFIISSEYIDPKEEVVILPTSSVVTDMTDNQDGTYTADEAGQTILQTVDATSLITQYGGKSKVTSIGSIGVPAYKAATGLSNLVGIDKISGTITEHDSIALSTNSTLGAIDVWNTNITIEVLNGKQIGWKAAT